MANFPGLILTDAGRDILAQAIAGEDLVFTRVALGDGLSPANPEALTTLVSEKRNAPIQSFAIIGNGTSRIRAIVTNVGLAAGFFAREVGVFATDPSTGNEVLYAYANAGTQADYLPAEGGATIVEQLFDLITVVDTAPNVVAVINDSLIYATKDELTGVAIEGDTLVFPGSTNSYLITNFSSFASYSVSSDIGTATVTGDTVSLVIDAGQASGGLNMIVTRDGYEYVFRIAIGEQSVATPSIENPANGVTNVGSGVTLTTSAFLTYPENADTHASTDWQVATDSGFTSIVFESLDDAANLEAIAVPSGTFDESTTYYARARHTGSTLGDGAYSSTVTFTTKASFYPSTEIAKILASDGQPGDAFGEQIAISGNYAIISSVYDDDKGSNSGSAYIFERNSGGTWTEVANIVASDGAASDSFGCSVAISGNYAIVGAFQNDDSGNSSGSAYIFERDGAGVWTQKQKLVASDASADARFGVSVAISGNYAIVGASLPSLNGTAYVFERSEAGAWGQTQKLLASDGQQGDGFGISVAMSGDAAIIGASTDDDNGSASGSAYIFERDGAGVWTQSAKILASDGSASDGFGKVVSISGDYALSTSDGADEQGSASGAIYIFEKDGAGNWNQKQKLLASDGAANARFGRSASISGDYAIVGTNFEAAYVFGRSGAGVWSQLLKLTASDSASGDYFGWGVSIDGSYGIVGARGFSSTTGAAYVYE